MGAGITRDVTLRVRIQGPTVVGGGVAGGAGRGAPGGAGMAGFGPVRGPGPRGGMAIPGGQGAPVWGARGGGNFNARLAAQGANQFANAADKAARAARHWGDSMGFAALEAVRLFTWSRQVTVATFAMQELQRTRGFPLVRFAGIGGAAIGGGLAATGVGLALRAGITGVPVGQQLREAASPAGRAGFFDFFRNMGRAAVGGRVRSFFGGGNGFLSDAGRLFTGRFGANVGASERALIAKQNAAAQQRLIETQQAQQRAFTNAQQLTGMRAGFQFEQLGRRLELAELQGRPFQEQQELVAEALRANLREQRRVRQQIEDITGDRRVNQMIINRRSTRRTTTGVAQIFRGPISQGPFRAAQRENMLAEQRAVQSRELLERQGRLQGRLPALGAAEEDIRRLLIDRAQEEARIKEQSLRRQLQLTLQMEAARERELQALTGGRLALGARLAQAPRPEVRMAARQIQQLRAGETLPPGRLHPLAAQIIGAAPQQLQRQLQGQLFADRPDITQLVDSIFGPAISSARAGRGEAGDRAESLSQAIVELQERFGEVIKKGIQGLISSAARNFQEEEEREGRAQERQRIQAQAETP